MSDTDDTEDLLLIPPNFFLIQNEPEPPYYSIVDSLIKQVSNLQNRIETIESTSDVSLVGSYLDQSFDSQLAMHNNTRKLYSSEDLYQPTSTQSTPQKPHHTNLKLNSLPASPNVDRYSPRKTGVRFRSPQKTRPNDSEVLNEIDTFISNVKTIQRNHVRSLQNEFKEGDNGAKNDRNVQEVMEELERQSQKILEAQKKGEAEVNVVKEGAWRCGDNVESVPDFGAGVRHTLYKPPTHESKELPVKQTRSTNFENPSLQPTSSSTDFTSYTTLDKSSDSSSDSTQVTAYNRLYNTEKERDNLLHSPLHSNALNVLNMHKKLLDSSENVRDGRVYKRRGINTLSDSLGLLSLADIWGSGHLSQSPSKLAQKLQEEKMRRQHCEQLITELQYRNLELQQKLAVAMQVDDTKNKTIQQFKDAVEKVSFRMEKLNDEKNTWEQEMARVKNQYSMEIETASQKIIYYEKEASKALNLAHSNQEKISFLEKRCCDLQSDLQVIESKFKEVEDSYKKEFEKNKQLADIVSQKEIELNDNKNVLNNARDEVFQSRKAVEVCQSEFTALKNECSKLQSELRQEKSVIINLSEQKRKLVSDIQNYKANEKSLKESLEESKLKLESTKLELRNFYQGQLEIIVENKRKEMQSQLDQERRNSVEEVKRKELSVAKTAANHIKEISEKSALETKLLEQKHQEEIRLYQIQLSQYKKEIENLQAKLANLPEKRAQIAKQLQQVMETQWNEALKMISSSPSSFSEQQAYNTFNSVNQKPYNMDKSQQMAQKGANIRDEHLFESVSDYDETPVSSRAVKNSESEIQKYINMLLNRPPGNPTKEPPDSGIPQSQIKESTTWHPGVRPRKPK